MKCAFLVQMPQQRSDESENEEENLDDEQLKEDMSSEEDTELPWSTGERIFYFAQSFQLLANDGMREIRNILAFAKTFQFTTLVYSSSQFEKTSLTNLKHNPHRNLQQGPWKSGLWCSRAEPAHSNDCSS